MQEPKWTFIRRLRKELVDTGYLGTSRCQALVTMRTLLLAADVSQAAALIPYRLFLSPSPAPSPSPLATSWVLAPSPMVHSASSLPANSEWTSVYRWIPIVGALITFMWSLAIGANDVACSFGTSVGSKALSMVMAVLLAAVMEFTGAVFFGDRTIDTFQSSVLKEVPANTALLMWGLFIALLVQFVLALRQDGGMPVSSTVTILGAIIGVSLAGEGFKSIFWKKATPTLHLGGVLGIILSWVIAPVLAGLASFSLFGFTKMVLLRSTNSQRWTLRAIPLYYGITVFTLVLFLIYRGTPRATSLRTMKAGYIILIAAGSGVVASLIACVIMFWFGLRRLRPSNKIDSSSTPEVRFNNAPDSQHKEMQEHPTSDRTIDLDKTADDLLKQYAERHHLETVYEADEEENALSPQETPISLCTPRVTFQQMLHQTSNRSSFIRMRSRKQLSWKQNVTEFFKKTYFVTINHDIVFDRQAESRHHAAEKFDGANEELFSFLQILTACVAAFSHGSNEVVADLNPYSSIMQLYCYHNNLGEHSDVPEWVLVLGGAGVCLGFALWGWKVVRCIGGGITYISPSRGYCAQICAVAAGLLATRAGLPVSTTHILIGSILGVGLADNAKDVNWKLLLILLVAWVATLVLSSTTAAGFYSFTIYSPSYSAG